MRGGGACGGVGMGDGSADAVCAERGAGAWCGLFEEGVCVVRVLEAAEGAFGAAHGWAWCWGWSWLRIAWIGARSGDCED